MIWSSEEDALVRQMYATHTRRQIAAVLGRTEGMVRSRCWTLRLADKRTPWSAADIAALRDAYTGSGPLGVASLASQLSKTVDAVSLKASRLGLTNAHRHRVPGGHKVKPPKYATAAERGAATSARVKALWAERGHPRGMLGKTHSAEERARFGLAVEKAWKNPASGFNKESFRQAKSDAMTARNVLLKQPGANPYSRCAQGRRPDLGGRYFRSSWEANYARYLNLLVEQRKIASWDYECHTFTFDKISRGTRTYMPDFKVVMPDGRHEWHEVKGWMNAQSKTRLARMAKYFPEERLVIIGEEWFRQAKRGGLAGALPGWESRGRGARGC